MEKGSTFAPRILLYEFRAQTRYEKRISRDVDCDR